MSSTLGEKLRQAREERGISVSEVAEQTRISPLYIESIEKDDYKVLPGGIFNKGFIKSYAKYVGYDEQEALQEYAKMVITTENRDPDEVRSYRPEVLTDDRSNSSMLPTIIFAGIILALMTGGILFVVNYLQNKPEEAAINAKPSPSPDANTAQESAAAVPAVTDQISVELKAVSEPVWMSYTLDGANSVKTLAADEALKLDAKESLKISYSKSKLPNLQIFLNGTKINPPTTGTKGNVEFEINKSNVAQLMQSGNQTANFQQSPASEPERVEAAAPRRTPSVAQTATPAARTAANTNTSTPRPRTTPRPTIADRPKATQTPIVVGQPRSNMPAGN